MAKKNENSLAAVVTVLKEQKKIDEDQLAGIEKIRDFLLGEIDANRQEKLQEKAGNKLKDKSKKQNDDSNVMSALLRGDFISAIFGTAGALAIITGIVTGISLFANTINEAFDPDNPDGISKDISRVLAGVVGILSLFRRTMNLFLMPFKWIIKLLSKNTVINGLFNGLKGIMRKIEIVTRSLTKISFGVVFNFIRGLGRAFKIILIIDGLIRSTLAGFKAFNNTDGTFTEKLIAAAKAFFKTAILYTVDLLVQTVKDVFMIINWIFDDFYKWVSNLGIPIISDAARIIRNFFLWFKELFAPVFNFLQSAWVDVQVNFIERFGSFSLFLDGLLNGIFSFGEGIFNAVDRFIKATGIVIAFVLDELGIPFDSIKEFWKNFTGGIETFISDARKWLARFGIKTPDWNPITGNAPDISTEDIESNKERQRRKREEQLERLSEARANFENDKGKRNGSVIIAPSTQQNNTSVSTQNNNIVPPMRPYDEDGPIKSQSY